MDIQSGTSLGGIFQVNIAHDERINGILNTPENLSLVCFFSFLMLTTDCYFYIKTTSAYLVSSIAELDANRLVVTAHRCHVWKRSGALYLI